MIRGARGARDALFAHPMLPQLEYLDDLVDDDEETRMLRELEQQDEEWKDEDDLDTRLMPAKHGAKSPTLASRDRLQVPSPYPSAPKQYASGVRKKATPPPPPPKRSDPPELPSLFAEMYSSVEPTGSEVHAPVRRLDGCAPVLPSTTALAARRSPWAIQVTPPEFEPFAMPMFQPPGTRVVQADAEVASGVATAIPKKKSHRSSAIFGGVLGIACGFLVVSIANGTITAKDARTMLVRGAHVVDVVLAHL